MNTKHKSFFFFLLIILFSSNSIAIFIPSVKASEIDQPIINAEILGVNFGNFVDNTAGDGSNKLGYSFGGEDLIYFKNMGETGRNLETNEIIYRARAKFGLGMNAWTKCDFRDHYPQINLEKETEVVFLNYALWGRTVFWIPFKLGDSTYHAKYNEIDFGNVFKRHNYDGVLPFTLYIKDLLRFSENIEIAGQDFSVPSLLGQITNVKVVETRAGETGSYEDQYTDIAGVKEGSVEFVVVDDRVSSQVTQVANWLNEQNLGWQSNKELGSTSIQQAIKQTYPVGAILPDSNFNDNQWTSNLPILLQPGIEKQSQYVKVKWASVKYVRDPPTEFLIEGGPSVQTYRRDVSVHVYNQFTNHELEIEVDFFMTVKFAGEISESFLEDPNLTMSDMFWDTSIIGDSVVTIGLTATQDIFMMILNIILWLVILAISVLVIVKIVIPYFSRRVKRK